jgi:hypothetical protein
MSIEMIIFSDVAPRSQVEISTRLHGTAFLKNAILK